MKHLGIALSFLALVACGDEDTQGPDDGDGCSSCTDTELCVIEYSDPKLERCEPIPEVCGDTGSCADIDCQSAMYDYCPESTTAYGCSDTMAPTFISCTL